MVCGDSHNVIVAGSGDTKKVILTPLLVLVFHKSYKS